MEIHPVYTHTCHYVELLLQKELPEIYAAFSLSGFPASQICQVWIRQCFLNYLDWNSIIWYICTCLTMGIDYQIYFCLALLKHSKKDILQYSQDGDMIRFLKSNPVAGFEHSNYFEFMNELQRKYGRDVMADLVGIWNGSADEYTCFQAFSREIIIFHFYQVCYVKHFAEMCQTVSKFDVVNITWGHKYKGIIGNINGNRFFRLKNNDGKLFSWDWGFLQKKHRRSVKVYFAHYNLHSGGAFAKS